MIPGLVLMILGAIVIGLPDDDNRLFSFSEDHGPSALDALGIAVLLAGWALLARLVWRRREALPRGPRATAALAGAFAAGAVVLAVGIGFDLGALWVLGAAMMAAAQGYLLTRAARTPR